MTIWMKASALPTLLLFAAGVTLGATAQAEPKYTAKDIVEHFQSEQSGQTRSLTRALCMGTASECEPNVEPSKDETVATSPFNLQIEFPLDSAELTPLARDSLDEFATAIQELDDYSFYVDGHTDQRGSAEYNQNLSEMRARSVVEYLQQRGVAAQRLTPRGFGETKPAVQDGFADANRRVETDVRQN